MQRGLIFDLDGVLSDTAELHYRSWRRLARELGLEFDRAANEALLGRSREEALELFLAGRPTDEDREELLRRKNGYFLESLAEFGTGDLAPGVLELLDAASLRGLSLGLASSSRNAKLVCQKLGILDRFEAVADGCSGLRPKPEPDIFLWVAGALGLPPACCTVIEDARAGVEAARRGGFRVVGVGPAERVGEADLVVGGLAGLDLDRLLGAGSR
ncbi:MAG TPA: beta-phosphoglucomutase family hydrolase [Trueperaceae bacterium]